MERNRDLPRARRRDLGTGALCPEAQADGVPCTELGRDCEICERAVGTGRPPQWDPRARREEGSDPERDGTS
jgi:hypothetical protein